MIPLSARPETASVLTPNVVIKTGVLLLLGLWVGKELLRFNELLGQLVLTAMIAFQLYAPYWLYHKARKDPESEGLNVHGCILGPIAALRRRAVSAHRQQKFWKWFFGKPLRQWLAQHGRHAHFRPRPFKAELKRVSVIILVTFPPFAVAHHYFQQWMYGRTLEFDLQLPPEFLPFVVYQFLLVALPEELFYRGFMFGALEKYWPNQTLILGIPVGRAAIVSAVFFALAHFVGEYNFLRLGPFFPAFLFGYLRLRSGSIFGALVLHAWSNIFSQILFVSYQLN